MLRILFGFNGFGSDFVNLVRISDIWLAFGRFGWDLGDLAGIWEI